MIRKDLSAQTREDLKTYFEDRDYAVISVPKDEPARVYTIRATRLVETARRIHDLSPSATVVLGRALIGALLLTSLVKHASDQKVYLKIEGGGQIGVVHAEADGKGRVRGFVSNPNTETITKEVNGIRKFDIASVVGNTGTLTVVKDLGMGTPYTSVVPLVSGEIAQDIAYYLVQSEQIPSAVGIGVLVDKDGHVRQAGGFLVQTMGDISDKVLDLIETRVNQLPPVTTLFEEGKRPEDIAHLILEGMDPQLIGLKELEYYCPCSEEIAKRSILTLSEEDRKEVISDGVAELVCNFCKRVYRFSEEGLRNSE